MSCPPFAILRAGQQIVDQPGDRVLGSIIDEILNFLGVGGRPIKLRNSRRIKVRRSAPATGFSRSASSLAMTKRSIGLLAHARSETTGTAGRRTGWKAQCFSAASAAGGAAFICDVIEIPRANAAGMARKWVKLMGHRIVGVDVEGKPREDSGKHFLKTNLSETALLSNRLVGKMSNNCHRVIFALAFRMQ